MRLRNCLFIMGLFVFMVVSVSEVVFAERDYDSAWNTISDVLSRCSCDDEHATSVWKRAERQGLNAFDANKVIIDKLLETMAGNCSTFSRFSSQVFEDNGIPNVIIETEGALRHSFVAYMDKDGKWRAFDPMFFVNYHEYKRGTLAALNREELTRLFKFGETVKNVDGIYNKPLETHLKFFYKRGAVGAKVWHKGASEAYFKDQPRFFGMDIYAFDVLLKKQTGQGFSLDLAPSSPLCMGAPYNINKTEKVDSKTIKGVNSLTTFSSNLLDVAIAEKKGDNIPEAVVSSINSNVSYFPLWGALKSLVPQPEQP